MSCRPLALVLLLTGCPGDDPPADPDAGSTSDTSTAGPSTTLSGSGVTGSSVGTSSSTDALTSSTDAGPTTETGEDPTTGGDSSSSSGLEIPPSSTRHTPRPLGTTEAAQGYWEYLPYEYEAGAAWPLIVFQHGIGANGDGDVDLDRVLQDGPPRLIDGDGWPGDRPFVVLSPQFDGEFCPSGNTIQQFLTYAIANYDVDPEQIYLTGLSCGAIGSWSYLGQFTNTQVAAAVLIAGDGRTPFMNVGCDLGLVPIWAFHGDADGVVPVDGTIVPVEGLQMCKPVPDVQMTIYPGVGHDSWTQTYNLGSGHDIYAWFLEH